MEPTKPEKEKRSSAGVFGVVVIILIVLLICVGFLVGLWLLTQRIAKIEELVQNLNATCSKHERDNDKTSQRARRDTTPVTIEVVRSEIQIQLRSVTASQICAAPDKVCVPGSPGPKGMQGPKGRRGKKGVEGPVGPMGRFGPKGDAGYPGVKGYAGPRGYKGPKGDKGDPGKTGSSGSGATGESGGAALAVYVSPNVSIVTENAPATFRCFAYGNPTPSVTWERLGGGGLDSSSGRLLFAQTKRQDTGTYVCKAFNLFGSSQATAELKVQGKPLIREMLVNPTRQMTVKAYGDVSMFCHVIGYPTPSVHWLKADYRNLPEGRTEIRHDGLVIKETHVEDTGVYICRAQNFHGTEEMRVNLTVKPRTGQGREDAVRNCKELQAQVPGVTSGTYWVDLDLGSPDNAFQTYCDMETDGGGWTLVWSYGLSSERWYSTAKRFTPRPSFPNKRGYVKYAAPLSFTPPLNESMRGALNFSLWQTVGSELLMKSNLINWYVCKDDEGSILKWKDGTISCRTILVLVAKCSAVPTHLQTDTDYGLKLSSGYSTSLVYKMVVTSYRAGSGSILDACARSRPGVNQLQNVGVPQGSWYVR